MKNEPNAEETGFPARFKEFLDAFKLNTNRLATELNDSNRVKYGRWLSGEANPSYEGLVQIATHYGVSMNWLMLGHGPMLEKDIKQPAMGSAPLGTNGSNLVDSDPDWKALYLDVVNRLNVLQEKYDKIVDVVLSKMSFPETSSYSPVPPQPRQWITGLRSSLVPDFNGDEAKCIVRPLWPVNQAEQLQMA